MPSLPPASGLGSKRQAERVLIARVLSGEPDAENEFYRAYLARVRNIVKRIVPENEVEDICQDVFLQAFRKLKGFRGEAALSTWLSRIAFNFAYYHIRTMHSAIRDSRLVTSLDQEHEEAPSLAANFPDDRPNPEQRAITSERQKFVNVAMRKLCASERIALKLYLGGLLINEVAEAMGITPGCAKSYIFRGRFKLRETLRAGNKIA